MLRGRDLLAVLAATSLAAGCAGKGLYNWSGYNAALYRHYKNPQDRETFIENLERIIRDSEGTGTKVPPGIYAEYGYALFEVGRYGESVTWFARERDEWPESQVFMEKMIRNAGRAQAGRGTAAPGGPTVAPGGASRGGGP